MGYSRSMFLKTSSCMDPFLSCYRRFRTVAWNKGSKMAQAYWHMILQAACEVDTAAVALHQPSPRIPIK
jgi:hypothetical protein